MPNDILARCERFITAKNGIYAFDVNRTFWAWIDEQLDNKVVQSPASVYKEIVPKKNDALSDWVKARKKRGLCREPDTAVHKELAKVANYVFTASRYKQAQAMTFSRGADAWVIAHAMATNGTVVTFETNKQPLAQRIRIPDVCGALDVPYTDLLGLLRALKAQL